MKLERGARGHCGCVLRRTGISCILVSCSCIWTCEFVRMCSSPSNYSFPNTHRLLYSMHYSGLPLRSVVLHDRTHLYTRNHLLHPTCPFPAPSDYSSHLKHINRHQASLPLFTLSYFLSSTTFSTPFFAAILLRTVVVMIICPSAGFLTTIVDEEDVLDLAVVATPFDPTGKRSLAIGVTRLCPDADTESEDEDIVLR